MSRGYPVEGVLDKGIIPFADGLGSTLLCLDYRTDYDHPRVESWRTGTGRVSLAPTFAAFLDLLEER